MLNSHLHITLLTFTILLTLTNNVVQGEEREGGSLSFLETPTECYTGPTYVFFYNHSHKRPYKVFVMRVSLSRLSLQFIICFKNFPDWDFWELDLFLGDLSCVVPYDGRWNRNLTMECIITNNKLHPLTSSSERLKKVLQPIMMINILKIWIVNTTLVNFNFKRKFCT